MDTYTRSVLALRDTASDQILRLIADPFGAQLANQSLVASLGVSLGFTLVIAILFSLVRPLNTAVYQPKLKQADGKPAPLPLGKSPWAWIPAVLRTNEDELVRTVGIDAALFIRFTQMLRNIFLIFTVLGCCVLIPASVIQGKPVYKAWAVSSFMKVTPQFVFGRIFWAYVAVAYMFNVVVCIFLFFNYRAVVRLRRRYYNSEEYQRSLYSRTLMLRDVPSKDRSDDALLQMMMRLQTIDDVPRAVIGRNVKDLPDLIESREKAVRKLESYLAKYLKNPDNLPPQRPLYKPSRKERKRYGSEPIDAIDHFTARIQHLERSIKEVRDSVNARDVMPYGFISYPTIEGAHYTAFSLRKKRPQGTTIRMAPRPNDLIWKNLGLSPGNRRWQKFVNNIWVALLTLAWTAPNAMIAIFLTNFNNLAMVWPAFAVELQKNPRTWAVVQGVLAPALTSLFYFILPSIFRRLSIKAGDVTKTSRERHVTHQLYAFFVFNNLIIFSLFSTVWKWVADLIAANKHHNQDLLTVLKNSNITSRIMIGLCNMSPFWVFWLLQRNLGAAIDLSQVAHLAWVSIVRRFTSPTPRELIELIAPPPFDYASYYNYFLFYATVAICFAPLQPLVLPVTAFYFGLDCYLKKYLLLYVFITKTESGGQFWRVLFNRVLFATFLGDIVVAIVVTANGYDWKMLYALIPLPIALVLFKYFCATRFDDKTHFFTTTPPAGVAGDGGLRGPEAGLSTKLNLKGLTKVNSKFGHPALYKKLITPMVHANARHVLPRVYRGRTDLNDLPDDIPLKEFSETHSLNKLARPGVAAGHLGGSIGSELDSGWNDKAGATTALATSAGAISQFRFVEEADIQQEKFANHPDFYQTFHGDEEMSDTRSQTSTPGPSVPLNPVMGSGTTVYDPGLASDIYSSQSRNPRGTPGAASIASSTRHILTSSPDSMRSNPHGYTDHRDGLHEAPYASPFVPYRGQLPSGHQALPIRPSLASASAMTESRRNLLLGDEFTETEPGPSQRVYGYGR